MQRLFPQPQPCPVASAPDHPDGSAFIPQSAKTTDEIQTWLVTYLANVLKVNANAIDVNARFDSYGLDSVTLFGLTGDLESWLGHALDPTLLYSYPTIARFAQRCRAREITALADLASEVVLDPQIRPRGPVVPKSPAPIFLTGATGFLGAFLLHELLQQTEARIYCLVRASDQATGLRRLRSNLQTYHLWRGEDRDRIIPIIGDLSQPYFGLSPHRFEQLARPLDRIYHSGALLNYLYAYDQLRSINVQGTQEVLRLASWAGAVPVHYVSSTAVFDSPAYAQQTLSESDPLVHWDGIGLGYSQSKWVAEKLVRVARDRGLPVCIYRPSFIAGHSQTGVVNTDDIICRLIKGCWLMGQAPILDYRLDLVPVDFVSRSIVHLSGQPAAMGQAFHLTNPHPYFWHQLIDWMNAAGFKAQLVPYRDWLRQLHRQSSHNPLVPLRPFLRQLLLGTELTLPESYQQARRPQFASAQTQALLATAAIACPRIDAPLLQTYFDYFLQSGCLTPPLIPNPV